MNKIFPGMGIGIVAVVIIYFVGFEDSEIENNQKILEIIDHEIIQNENN